MSALVRITNWNDFVMADRYNGDVYVFRPGQPLVVSPAVAAHFFGWPGTEDEVKSYTSKRFAWDNLLPLDKRRVAEDRETMLEECRNRVDTYWSNLTIEAC